MFLLMNLQIYLKLTSLSIEWAETRREHMRPIIRAILFDIGGTLRATQGTNRRDLNGIRQLMDLVGITDSPEEFIKKIRDREMTYRKWSRRTLVELTEADLWQQYLLPEQPANFIRSHAVTLNEMWRNSRVKNLLPDAIETLHKLKERGYILGIISNTTSSIEAPRILEENGVTNLFSTIILSTVAGRRKPHPSLFLNAAQKIGVQPDSCAYVGDQVNRDLIGARQAGYGEVVIIDLKGYQLDGMEPDDDFECGKTIAMQPDFKIGRLRELLELYPGQNQPASTTYSQNNHRFDLALSTMWGVDQDLPFNQTFELGRSAGFSCFELNPKVTPDLSNQWNKNQFYISTLHDPCPAEFIINELKVNDYVISSLDEACRKRGVDIARQTIDTACELGARSVVIHPGITLCDRSLERRLRTLFKTGKKNTSEYQMVMQELIADRARVVPPLFDQVVKSMMEIIEYARPTGIEVGLENRYYFYDIPIPFELQVLLELCDEDWYGFQYDSGHAYTLNALGLFDHEEWLKRFGNRIIGAHLHDVQGIDDHQIPGTGDVDFKMIARYLPPTAFRSLEVAPRFSVDELRRGAEVLTHAGCVERIP